MYNLRWVSFIWNLNSFYMHLYSNSLTVYCFLKAAVFLYFEKILSNAIRWRGWERGCCLFSSVALRNIVGGIVTRNFYHSLIHLVNNKNNFYRYSFFFSTFYFFVVFYSISMFFLSVFFFLFFFLYIGTSSKCIDNIFLYWRFKKEVLLRILLIFVMCMCIGVGLRIFVVSIYIFVQQNMDKNFYYYS